MNRGRGRIALPQGTGEVVIEKVFDRTARAIELVLAVAFMLVVVLNFSNVIARYVFGRSILWADEVQIFTMIAITFLGAVIVSWRRQHLKMDVLSNMLPRPLRTLLQVVELALMLGLCAFIFFHSLDYTSRMFDIGRTSDTAGIPMWIPHGTVALGFGLIALVSLWQAARALRTGSTEDTRSEPRQETN